MYWKHLIEKDLKSKKTGFDRMGDHYREQISGSTIDPTKNNGDWTLIRGDYQNFRCRSSCTLVQRRIALASFYITADTSRSKLKILI